jgi:adenylate cyclase
MDNGVITVDLTGKITTFNAAASKMMGLSKKDVLGLYLNDVLFRNIYDEDFTDVLVDLLQREEKELSREIEFTKPDKEIIPLSLNTSILENGEKQEIGVIIVLTDLSLSKKTKFLKDTFSRYVAKQVVDQILDDPKKNLGLHGEKIDASVMFADIRNFTSISESLSAKKIVAILNEYFSRMIDIIFKLNGTIDKFIGDGMMCIFGAPIRTEDHAFLACKAALMMQEEITKMNQTLPVNLSVGIGINSGYMIVGNIGSERRLDYTVIGDNVNIAARLEQNAAGGDIIISKATYKAAKKCLKTKNKRKITLKGKAKPVLVYNLTALK